MEDLPDDPIDAVFALNEEMVSRVPRIAAIVDFALWAALFLTVVSAAIAIFLWVLDTDIIARVAWMLVVVAAPIMFWLAYRERRFLTKYFALASAVNRAKDWEPESEIPEGEEPIDRILEYLKTSDKRFRYLLEKRPRCLKRDYEAWGLPDNQEYYFDAYFSCQPYPWHRVREGLQLFVKVLPLVDVEDVDELLFVINVMTAEPDRPGLPVRVILLQTESGEFSDEVIEHVEESWFEYERTVVREAWDWSSPIELIAEDPEGHYNVVNSQW